MLVDECAALAQTKGLLWQTKFECLVGKWLWWVISQENSLLTPNAFIVLLYYMRNEQSWSLCVQLPFLRLLSFWADIVNQVMLNNDTIYCWVLSQNSLSTKLTLYALLSVPWCSLWCSVPANSTKLLLSQAQTLRLLPSCVTSAESAAESAAKQEKLSLTETRNHTI